MARRTRQLTIEETIQKKEAERFSKRKLRPFTQKKLEYYKKLVDWHLKIPKGERKETLLAFADGEKREYEKACKAMNSLGYATDFMIVGGKRKRLSLEEIPKTHWSSVKKLWHAFDNQLLNEEECREAARVYLGHDFFERINALYPLEHFSDKARKRIEELQKKQRKAFYDIYDIMRKFMDAPFTRAYNILASKIGKDKRQLKNIIETLPRTNVEEGVMRWWEAKLLEARAILFYHSMRVLSVELYRNHLEKLRGKERQL